MFHAVSRSNRFAFIFAALFASGTASAAEVPQANILAGNLAVDGFIELNRRSGSGFSETEYDVSGAFSYFIVNHFAVGVRGALSGSSETNTGALAGPSVTYFFWNERNLASYSRVSAQFGLTDVTIRSVVRGEVGLEHFIVPSVAVGPVLSYSYYNGRTVDYERLGFGFHLSVYL